MKRTDVSIIDYGAGNLLSVSRALEFLGASVKTASKSEDIANSSKIILPGVGAFSSGMSALRKSGLDQGLKLAGQKGVPILGICLGMQMLLSFSEEFGHSDGLGLIPGKVKEIPRLTTSGQRQKIPHIGWNEISTPNHLGDWQGTILAGLNPQEPVYFSHSFRAVLDESKYCQAICNYGGHNLVSVISNENIIGCQFHPEKSGQAGLHVLKNFLGL